MNIATIKDKKLREAMEVVNKYIGSQNCENCELMPLCGITVKASGSLCEVIYDRRF
jgi:hypothetical protein